MELLRGGKSRRIAVPVTVIVGTVCGDIFALWGLRELPDFGEGHATLGRTGRVRRKGAAGRGRAGVVDRPIDDLASSGALANVFDSDNVIVVRSRDAGAVDAGAESAGSDGIHPGIDIRFLFGKHASALLLVEEDDGLHGETFLACGSGGSVRVGVAKSRCAGD